MAHPASGRKKTDHINFGKAVEGIPNGSYASRVVHEITRRRQALEDVLKYPDTSTSTVMNALHGYLVLPMRHVLNEARRPYKLKFKWTSFIHPDEEMFVSKDSDVDHVAFLVAVSLWLMEHAQMAFPLYPKEDSLNEEKMKDALNSLKLAAGLCECVEQRPKSDYLDLTVPVNQALRLQCLAQAQMVTINRAVWKGNKASLISQLAHDVAKQCLAASSILKKCGKQVEKWRLFLVFKGELYFAIARCFQGIDFLEVQEKSGMSVAVLTTASRHISACYQLSKEYTKLKPKERHPLPACRDFIWAQNFITLKLEKSKRENSMVYHQRIPDEAPPLDDPKCLVSPTSFHFPDEDSLFDAVESSQSADTKLTPPRTSPGRSGTYL
ncbi:BRO1 domain-containing protein BROX-like isoform X2 [Xenia sp. Carnegie-2017]|uniref:BRO1 domain-containing protein BROX-like isoform X2 n=1 Tax=Xenia sp. Carnegie-2017 TaxID=2897299 RepID=UPI001F0407B2|nr:BRO1 domain-containing protein BROX-like isoform X2 [Xenia sp. Carnegie-2017]